MINIKDITIIFIMAAANGAKLLAMDPPMQDGRALGNASEFSLHMPNGSIVNQERSIEFDQRDIVAFGFDMAWEYLKSYGWLEGRRPKSILDSVFSYGYHGAVYPLCDEEDDPNRIIRHDSRKCVVDFFQENLIRFYQGKKLLQIQFALAYEEDEVAEFYPDIGKVITKTRIGTDGANAEIRMMYKLMHEIPDEDIKFLANNTIEFVKMKIRGKIRVLEPLKRPWEISPELWTNRTRKNQHRYESGVLRPDAYPQWIQALIKYKDDLKFGRPAYYPAEGTIAYALIGR